MGDDLNRLTNELADILGEAGDIRSRIRALNDESTEEVTVSTESITDFGSIPGLEGEDLRTAQDLKSVITMLGSLEKFTNSLDSYDSALTKKKPSN